MCKGVWGGHAAAVKMLAGGAGAVGAGGATATTREAKVPEAAMKMMRREAKIMCALNHPTILRVFGVVPERGWIVMELCEVRWSRKGWTYTCR